MLKRPKYLRFFIQVSNQYSTEYSWFLLLSRVYGDKCMPHQKNVHAVKFFIRKNKLIFLLVDLPVFGDITRLQWYRSGVGPFINPHVNSDSVQRSQLYPNVRHSAGATSVYRARTRTDHQSGGLRDSCQWQSHHKHRICLSQLLMQVRHRWAICLWIADKILLPWIVRWKSIGHIGDTTISESPNSYHRVQGPTGSCQVKFTPAQIEVSFGGHTQYFPRI